MTFRGAPTQFELPDNPAGYQLDPITSLFSVVFPTGVDKTNLCINPSFETNLTGWSSGGTVNRVSTFQRRGSYSMQLICAANNSNVIYTQGFTTTTGVLYFFSMDVLIPAGVAYGINFLTSANVVLVQKALVGTGYWTRVFMPYLETAGGTRRVGITNNSANRNPFYMDGAQIEITDLTTYIDGDQRGFIVGRSDYYWTGTPHGSTSIRIGQSASGGNVIPLSQVGFRLLAIAGLGLGGIVNFITPKAIGGAYYNGTITADRQFSLTGKLFSANLAELSRQRQGLIDLFRPDRVGIPQPVLLKYTLRNDCGDPVNLEFEIPCVFEGDLSGPIDNLYQSNIALTFRLYLPITAQETGNASAILGFNQSIANASNILMRTPTGTWQAVGTGTNGEVDEIVTASDGSIYLSGAFTLAGGVANTVAIAKWDGTAFTALTTGLQGPGINGYAMAVDAAGILYVGGDFSGAGGVANTFGIAKWSGSAWSAMGTGAGATTFDIVVGPDGSVYTTGTYATTGGVANTKGIAKWNGSAWSALGTGLGTASGDALVIGPDGLLYVSGLFATANGVTVNNIAKWTGSTFASLAGGSNGEIRAMAWGPDGLLYVGGAFTTIGGVAANQLAKWNGNSWTQVGPGFPAGVNIRGLAWIDGLLYINGSDSIWNGSAFLQPDVTYPAGNRTLMFQDFSKNIYSAFNGSSVANSGQVTVVNNPGTAKVGPVFTITGPGVVRSIRNFTNGKTIYFNLATLLANETAVLDLSNPSAISFVSSRQGNIIGKILSGSSLSDFTLLPGNNNISVFMTGGTGSSLVNITWRNSHHSIDAAGGIKLVP